MLFSIISTITGILGIIGFFCDISIMLYIAGVSYVVETIVELTKRTLHNISTTVLTIIISVFASLFFDYNILLGICFGLSIESVLLSIIELILMFVYFRK